MKEDDLCRQHGQPELWFEKLQGFLKERRRKIKEIKHYEQAFTHSSYDHEQGKCNAHNERLEFLGDAVLELVISRHLYDAYPFLPEGKLTRLRSDLVCEASLAKLAYQLSLGEYLRLGKGETAAGGSSRPSLLADSLEALFGALFLDLGLEEVSRCVLELYEPIFQQLHEGVLRQDYKTLIQEFAQARFAVTPEYRITGASGPDHDKVFEAEIILNCSIAGCGEGRSKKEAEQAAARVAWLKLTGKSGGLLTSQPGIIIYSVTNGAAVYKFSLH